MPFAFSTGRAFEKKSFSVALRTRVTATGRFCELQETSGASICRRGVVFLLPARAILTRVGARETSATRDMLREGEGEGVRKS